MTIMVDTQRALTGGVDTHADVHVAAVIDPDQFHVICPGMASGSHVY